VNRVLFIYQYAFSQTGGIQSFNRLFIQALQEIDNELKCKVDILSIYDKKEDYFFDLNFKTLNGSKSTSILEIIKLANRYDKIILGHVNLAILGGIGKIVNPKIEIIFCTHGIEVWKNQNFLTRRIMSNSIILSVSNFTKNQLLNFNNKLKDIRLFPNAVKDGFIEKSTKIDDYFNILTVSRLDETEKLKGVDTVIKSLAILKENVRKRIKYNVIGKGNDILRLKSLTKEYGVEDCVKFLGYVDDLEEYYASCDIFILTSKKEGFGIVYLEAMRHKKPVIASNFGGATDVVVNNQTGFLIDYSDTISLSEHINYFFYNESRKLEMGENGYDRYRQMFTYNKFKHNLEKIILE